jgi:hypothetical protein
MKAMKAMEIPNEARTMRDVARNDLVFIGSVPGEIMRNREAWRLAARLLALTSSKLIKCGSALVVDGVVVKVCSRGKRVSFSPAPPGMKNTSDDALIVSAVRNMQPGGLFDRASSEYRTRCDAAMLRVSKYMDGVGLKRMRYDDMSAELTDKHVIVNVPTSRFRALRDELLK